MSRKTEIILETLIVLAVVLFGFATYLRVIVLVR